MSPRSNFSLFSLLSREIRGVRTCSKRSSSEGVGGCKTTRVFLTPGFVKKALVFIAKMKSNLVVSL